MKLLPLMALVISHAVSAADPSASCKVTQPVRAKNVGIDGLWYVNADRTIWAGGATRMVAGAKGNKVPWLRPKETQLAAAARSLGDARTAEFDIPCCYGGRFQSSTIRFPDPGCWEISAKAGASELTFVTWVGAERPH